MTGPENYTAALHAIENAKDAELGSDQQDFLLRVAAVRATLALAAATAQAGRLVHGGGDKKFGEVTKPSPWWTALNGEARS